MKHKGLLRLLGSLVIVGITTALGALPASGATIRILDASEAHGYALEALAADYEKATGTKVEVEILPYDATYERQVLTFRSGGSDYDLMVYDCIWGAQYISNNWLLDIAPFMKDSNLPDINMGEFVPGIAEAYDIRGDAVYSIPVDYTNVILGYRTDLFEEAGLSGPPKNWSEFADYAKRLTKDTDGDGDIDQYGLIWHGGIPDSAYTDWLARVLGMKLPEGQTEFIFNPDVSKTVFMDHDYGVKAVEMVMDVAEFGPPGALAFGYGEFIQAIQQGMGAMFLTWNVIMAEFENPETSKVAGKVGYTAIPFDEEKNIIAGGWHMGINSQSNNAEEAYKFLAWIGSDEGQLAMIEKGAMTPYKQFIFDSEEWTNKYPIMAATAEAGADANVMAFPLTPKFVEMQQIMYEQLQAAFSGVKSPEKAMTQAAKEIDGIL